MLQSYLHAKYYFIFIINPKQINRQTTITLPSQYKPILSKTLIKSFILTVKPKNITKVCTSRCKTPTKGIEPSPYLPSSLPIFPSLLSPLKAGPIVPNSTKYNEINIIFVLEESVMAQAEYRLKTTRSRLDYELFQVALPKYDPQLIEDVYIDLPSSLRIRPETEIGRVFLRNDPEGGETLQRGKELLLATNFSGQLQAMAEHFERMDAGGKSVFHLKSPQKKGQLAVLSIRECDHRPRDETFLNSNFSGQSTASTAPRRTIADSVTVCEGCQTVLWKYYEREEIAITLGELCKVNSRGELRELLEDFEWSIVLNEQFTPRTEVGRCGGQEMTLPYLAKATFLLDFTEHRKKLREDTVIMRIRRVICKHEKVMDDCCQFCLQQVKQEHLSQFTNYLFQNQSKPNSVLVTGSALRQHEEMYIDGLLSNNKAMIILDLDNTILHSCEISDLDIKTVLALKDFYLIPKIDCPFQEEKGKRDLIVVKMRPYFRHFLYVVTKLYEVYVYTKGTRVYAQEICKYIRAQYAGEDKTHPYLTWQSEKLLFLQGKKSFATNIISRDQDSNLDSKSFDRILPSKTEYHLILDDRRDVWNNSPAWFFTREYYYFLSKGKKMAECPPPSEDVDDIGHYLGSSAEIPMAEMKGGLIEEYKMIKTQYPQKKDAIMEVNARNDYFLLFAAYALRKIHKNFFEALKLEKQEGEKDREGPMMMSQQHGSSPPKRKFNRINLAYQYNRTKHFFKNLKIQCFLGEGQDENNNNTVRRAKKMGATITDDSPQFAIRANDLMKQTKKPQTILISPESIPLPPPSSEVPAGEYYVREKAELKELFDKKVPVLSQSWIHYCYEFHYPFSSKEFVLSDPFQQEVNHEDFSPYIDREAKLILDKIEEEMARDCNGDHRRQGVTIHPQPIRHKREKKQQEKSHQKSII